VNDRKHSWSSQRRHLETLTRHFREITVLYIQLADDNLGVNFERNVQKFSSFCLKIIYTGTNILLSTFHSQSTPISHLPVPAAGAKRQLHENGVLKYFRHFIYNPPLFVVCHLQVQNGDIKKTACWSLKMSPLSKCSLDRKNTISSLFRRHNIPPISL
jgi:hypothetical protein